MMRPKQKNGKEARTVTVGKEQQKRVNKYIKDNYYRPCVTYPGAWRAAMNTHAAAQGESLAEFMRRAVRETIERDGGHLPGDSAGG